MGSGTFTASDWSSFKEKKIDTARTVDDIYTSKTVKEDFDPKRIKIRESCDSDEHPNSTPVIVGLDVTGSMDPVLNQVVRTVLPKLVTSIYERNPISDPHLMFMGIGDVYCDSYPLQATQFEADIRVAEQLSQIYLEGGGGPNDNESYPLAWYFAGNYTCIDSFEKRNSKGYIFTIGDEKPTMEFTGAEIEKAFGSKVQFTSITAEQMLQSASRQYEVYHLILTQGNNYRQYVEDAWKNLLGQNAVKIDDYTKIGEVITSILQKHSGLSDAEIVKSWDGSTALTVEKAIKDINITAKSSTSGLVTF